MSEKRASHPAVARNKEGKEERAIIIKRKSDGNIEIAWIGYVALDLVAFDLEQAAERIKEEVLMNKMQMMQENASLLVPPQEMFNKIKGRA